MKHVYRGPHGAGGRRHHGDPCTRAAQLKAFVMTGQLCHEIVGDQEQSTCRKSNIRLEAKTQPTLSPLTGALSPRSPCPQLPHLGRAGMWEAGDLRGGFFGCFSPGVQRACSVSHGTRTASRVAAGRGETFCCAWEGASDNPHLHWRVARCWGPCLSG